MTSSRYICFLDLVGAKDIAEYDSANYYEAMTEFRDALIDTLNLLILDKSQKPNIEIHFFSDSAFIESSNLKKLLDFIRRLRFELFDRTQGDDPFPYFFTAGITSGAIKALTIPANLTKLREEFDNDDLDKIRRIQRNITGTMFLSKDVSKVYLKQLELKGIGINLDEKALNRYLASIRGKGKNEKKKVFERDYISKSFYFPTLDTSQIRIFNDVKFTPGLLSERSNLGKIYLRYFNANTKDVKLGKYYISLLANWISSEDFAVMKKAPKKANNKLKLDNVPIILEYLLYNAFENKDRWIVQEVEKYALGYEYLFFHLINKIYEDIPVPNNEITFKIVGSILSARKIPVRHLRRLKGISDSILSPKHKERFLTDYHSFKEESNKRKTKNGI